ncbi:diphthamide biosynthesis protein [Piedraia hortae CBS 480.64]|uniref:2-(3-amino-3-carboxypropyl)histidine synthase subunit 2 n=1 Tax=Piedraia hortae CBS 480.64 TaxID=1314780 RepID=A0A6A7C0T4_9PEZI|nr:diphthamide biosynthesis protein [Piedraia hortae CBS 480.64]
MESSAPILSTPAEHILEASADQEITPSRTSTSQLHIQYEIKRTIDEVRQGNWKRIALQFPDEMLVDAPRVFEALRSGLKDTIDKIFILGDTSYGSCCVDEVAAEHMHADIVVHYGRACLSPTTRLPVIYVFTFMPLDIDAVVAEFEKLFANKEEKVCLMAELPYQHHIMPLSKRLRLDGYEHVFTTEAVRDPASPLPNRTVPPETQASPSDLREYSIYHLSTPPTSLLLTLSSRVKNIHIFHDVPGSSPPPPTAQILKRRYALITRLSSASIFGILINTLSVKNYMEALHHCQSLIKKSGKKSYVFVVGKLNPAKVANFSEIDGWVVIGCWESSLVESKEFYRPIITPFELELALKRDNDRVWDGDWISDFSQLLNLRSATGGSPSHSEGDDGEDELPEFDLHTGRYVSSTRPLRCGRRKDEEQHADETGKQNENGVLIKKTPLQLANNINGTLSPAAEYLRTKRTWKGLGSDYEIKYEEGAVMEEGKKGLARAYID